MSALAQMMQDLFKAMRFQQIQDSRSQDRSRSRSTATPAAPPRESSGNPLPYEHPARAQVEGRPPLPPDHPLYQAWARGELGNSSEEGYSGHSVASAHTSSSSSSSGGYSPWTIGDVLRAIFVVPLLVPTGLAIVATVVLSPIFLAARSHQLWVVLINQLRMESSQILLLLSFLIGPGLIIGFLLSRIVIRPIFGRGKGSLDAIIASALLVALNTPVILDAWWIRVPNTVSMFAHTAAPLFEFLEPAYMPYSVWPTGTFSLAVVALGFGVFLGIID